MITIWGKPACPSCMKAKATCESRQLQYEYKELGKDFTREQVFEKFPGARTFPQIIVDGEKIGGFTEYKALIDTNKLGTI